MHFQYQVRCLPSCYDHQDIVGEAWVHHSSDPADTVSYSDKFLINFTIRIGRWDASG